VGVFHRVPWFVRQSLFHSEWNLPVPITCAEVDHADRALWVVLKGRWLVGVGFTLIGHQDCAAVLGELKLIGQRTCTTREKRDKGRRDTKGM
jgi:hypothetical protein